MREEVTKFGTRVHYSDDEVPGVIDEAREMFWEPFRFWRARLRWCPWATDPKYLLELRVEIRVVFVGRDNDVVRLLAGFQAFLDDHGDHVDQPRFPCHHHP